MNQRLPKIRLYSFGKPKSEFIPLLDYFTKRLGNAAEFEHIILKEKGSSETQTRQAASREILSRLKQDDALILLDETGKQYSSAAYADLLASQSSSICLVIGSSYGVDEQLKDRANHIVSLSQMVLPHELARILVIEQTYRAHCILNNHPYHHS